MIKKSLTLAVAFAALAAQSQTSPSAPAQKKSAADTLFALFDAPSAAPSARDRELVASALVAYELTVVVGNTGLLKSLTPKAGLPESFTIKGGRSFLVGGVPVTPKVSGYTVEFYLAGQPAPFVISSIPTASLIVRKTDSTIENVLSRWAVESGWKLIWANAPTVALTTAADYPSAQEDFLSAADAVVTQAKESGYQIKAVAYSNKVLVISGDTK